MISLSFIHHSLLFFIFSSFISNIPSISAKPINNNQYDYIVVGSGPGGGPLACRLAMAGFNTLLIEAGDDQSLNLNVTVPGYQARVTEDPKLRWDIFVNHYQDQDRAQLDPKYVWEIEPFNYHVGSPAPADSKPLGILYPRSSTIGGCASHNALIWIVGQDSDWNNIANLTGDPSWLAGNMLQYTEKVKSWLSTGATDPTILQKDLQLTQQYLAGASQMSFIPQQSPFDALSSLPNLLLNNPNEGIDPVTIEGFYQVPLTQNQGERDGVYKLIQSTLASGYPLTVQTNTFVTKITFDNDQQTPRATGVEYEQGQYLFKASPLSVNNNPSKQGFATATKEVIISAGAFNTPQLLILSGIGPKEELEKFDIPTLVDLPGVGNNLQDRYEIPVNVQHESDFSILNGCDFSGSSTDKCLQQWLENPYIAGEKGVYASNGLAASMLIHSDYADNLDIDMMIFGGPVNFNGYYPDWAKNATGTHNHFSWYTLKGHTRNTAGKIQLQSSNPFDQPLINFNYFDTGTTTDEGDLKDLKALVQALNISRSALSQYKDFSMLNGSNFIEQSPGPNVQTEEEIENYIKINAWGHHASCSAAIGSNSNPMAVLDSNFRVRGVKGLRVVDASVFPSIPGLFIQAPIYIISEKAADVIIQDAKNNIIPSAIAPAVPSIAPPLPPSSIGSTFSSSFGNF